MENANSSRQRNRRALFVTTTYPLKQGDSIPAFVADLAQSLVHDQGVSVRVIAPHHANAAKNEILNGVEITRFQYTANPASQCLAYGGGIPDNLRNFPRAKFQLPGFFAAMAKAVWQNAAWADIIHAHWVEPAFIAMAANWPRRPLIISVHSLKPKPTRLHRFTLARADRVLFNSQYTLTQAAAKGYTCPGQVIYQGYNDHLFNAHKGTGEMRAHLGVPAGAPLIVALGRMIEVKGLHVLAAAADDLLNQLPTAHLVIAGDGPMRPQIQAIATASTHHARIHLPGALPRHEVARLLHEATLFVNPGIIDSTGRAEGLGITTIEAMASGLPAVGSRVGGISETIVDEQTGLLIPPNNPSALVSAVTTLINNPSRLAQMSQAARLYAQQHFTWKALASQVAAVYRSL